MPSKIASETPFRLSTAFWTLLITFGGGWMVGLHHAGSAGLCGPTDPPSVSTPAPAPTSAVLRLPIENF